MDGLYMKKTPHATILNISIALGLIAICCLGIVLRQYNRRRIDVDQFSQYMLASPAYYQDMKEIEITDIEDHYPGVRASDLATEKVFVATDGTTREFAILEAKDTQTADTIQEALGRYCSGLLQEYQSESQEEYACLKAYTIRRTRRYLILTISDDANSGGLLVENYLDETNYNTRD